MVRQWGLFFAMVGVLGLIGAGSAGASVGALEKRVVIYSTHGEALLEVVADAFEEETGVAVDFINLKGQLADRVRAERVNPQADVMYGSPSSVFLELKSEGVFAPFFPSWAASIPSLFKDEAGYWFGTIQTPVVMFYNSEMMAPEEAPTDWSDLAKSQYKGQLVSRNALSSSARATYASLLQQYEMRGEMVKGWDFLKGVDANVKRYYGSGSLQFQAVGRREAALSFAVLNAVVDNTLTNHMPLEIIDAKSGSPVITDGIALIKGARHPHAAKAFIEFAGSPKIQALLATTFNRLPTHPDAIAHAPAWMASTPFKVMDVDWGALSATQSRWLQTWDTEVKNSGKDRR